MEKQLNPGQSPGASFPDVDIQVFDDQVSEKPIIEINHAQPHELSALLATFRSSWKIEITGYIEDEK